MRAITVTIRTRKRVISKSANISEVESERVANVRVRVMTNTDDEATRPKNFARKMDVPEKILFVIDATRERDCTPFKLSTGAHYMPMAMIKRVVGNFICIKSIIQRKHEYALMTLTSDSVQWICDFTSNTMSILERLNLLDDEVIEEEQGSYDFQQLVDKIQEKVSPLTSRMQNTSYPEFVIRTILIYSRSKAIPKLEASGNFHQIFPQEYFFMDVLYVHEPPSEENSCEEIYSKLVALNEHNKLYALEVGRNAAKLHDSMAKLLGHPAQRPEQRWACYTI